MFRSCCRSALLAKVLRVDSMPKFWSRDELGEFLNTVSKRVLKPNSGNGQDEASAAAGAQTENGSSPVRGDEASHPEETAGNHEDDESGDCFSQIKILFGPKTGISYGSAEITIVNDSVADALIHSLKFEDTDLRRGMKFSVVDPAVLHIREKKKTEQSRQTEQFLGSSTWTSI